MGWVSKVFKSGRHNAAKAPGDRHSKGGVNVRGPGSRQDGINRHSGTPDFGPDAPPAVSWEELTEILGPPPYGAAGTSTTPAGGVYGESNPNSRGNAASDIERFFAKTGRLPTAEESQRIEQRWLGWGYTA